MIDVPSWLSIMFIEIRTQYKTTRKRDFHPFRGKCYTYFNNKNNILYDIIISNVYMYTIAGSDGRRNTKEP